MNGEPQAIGVVCFDWGGVIMRICRHFSDGAAAAGLDVREGVKNPELYAVRRALSARYQVGELGEDEYFQAVSDSFDGLYSPAEIVRVHDAWLLGEYEGVGGVIDELHAAGRCETAMLSNTSGRHWERRLNDFPTAGTLKHQHASHLLGLSKPDPAIYKAFEQETGFAGSQIVFFDDLIENIDAASALGWRAVHIDHTGDTAVQIRTTLEELKLI